MPCTQTFPHQAVFFKKSVGAFFAAFLVLMLSPQAHAIKFSNQFTEFELPAKWQCALEGAEWVCQSLDETKKRDAIIILAAKIKGELDTLERYQQYLTGPRIFTAPNGASIKSTPKTTKTSQINNQPWVDSLHAESEIPGFYTRYLATVKQDIAVLVTYSINKNKYNEYQTQFDEMVKSLKVFRKAGGINQLAGSSLFNQNSAAIGTSSLFQSQTGDDANKQVADASKSEKKKPQSNNSGDLLLYLLLGGGVIGFVIWKKRQNSNQG